MSDTKIPVLEFSRNTNATYWGADGNLHTAAVDEPRYEYDPVTGEYLGLLVEGSATNHIANSENLDSGYWDKVNVNVESVEDDNFGTVWKLTDTDDGGTSKNHRLDGANNGAFPIHGLGTIYAKPGSLSIIRISAYSTDAKYHWVNVDLTTNEGKGDQRGLLFVSCVDFIDGWKKITVKQDSSSGSRQSFKIVMLPDNRGNEYGASQEDYKADGTGTIFVAMPQTEESSYPTSYIPTTGSKATRAHDHAKVSDLSIFGDFKQGTFVLDCQAYGPTSSNNVILYIPGVYARGLTPRNDSWTANFGSYANAHTFVEGEEVKVALSWDSSKLDLAICVSGEYNVNTAQKNRYQPDPSGHITLGTGRKFVKCYYKSVDFINEYMSKEQLKILTKK